MTRIPSMTSPVKIENLLFDPMFRSIAWMREVGVSQFRIPFGLAGFTMGSPSLSAQCLQQIGFVQVASAPTVYSRSTWTSLKCTTWNGGFRPAIRGWILVGAGLGKGTLYGLTSGGWQSPKRASQSLRAVCPSGLMFRRS